MLQIEDFKKKIMNNSRLLGLDLGKKRIGVAICDNKRLIATPYKTIIKKNFDQFLSELKIIINDNNISGIIIGNPINMDGSYGNSAQAVSDIANLISKNISIPITLWDERLSTVATYTLSGQLHIKASKKNKKIDQLCAT